MATQRPGGSPRPDDLDGPIADPGHHRVLFENDRVRVVETVIPPGATTELHTHLVPHVTYLHSGSHFVRRDEAGAVLLEAKATPAVPLARASWSDGTPRHRIENLGDEMLIILVELKDADGS